MGDELPDELDKIRDINSHGVWLEAPNGYVSDLDQKHLYEKGFSEGAQAVIEMVRETLEFYSDWNKNSPNMEYGEGYWNKEEHTYDDGLKARTTLKRLGIE